MTEQPWRERWDEVAGTRVRSLTAGERGPVVVLVPGLGALGYLHDTLAGCGAWARAFLLDVPGFGERGPLACPAELGAVAGTVAAWLDVPGEPVVLVGHSTGAQAALRAAVDRPDRVRSLVLLGPTFPPEQRRLPGLFRGYLRSSRHEPLGLLPVTAPYYLRGGPRRIARFVRSAQRDRPEQLITRVGCPVLLARGEQDGFAPQDWLDRLAAAAPDAVSRTLPGAHAFPYGQGGLTSRLIAEAALDRNSDLPGPDGRLR
ncbi:alpha/beta fold hydrolase [Crossiella sp. NPDC003009]